MTTTAAPADVASQFADEIIQGHREAFAALRQILSAAITAVAPGNQSPGAPPALPPPQARALAIGLRAAMAILRVRPSSTKRGGPEAPFRSPPRPLTRNDVIAIASSQRAGSRFLPLDVVPRLKAWQEYADHMGFPAPFDFPRQQLEKFPGGTEAPPAPSTPPAG